MTEQNQDKENGRLKHFWLTWRGWVLLVLLLLAAVVVITVLGGTGVIETGFDAAPADPSLGLDGRRGKTLWDWMDLLVVPLALAIGAAFFTWVTDKRAREVEEDQIKEQRRIEEDRLRQAALQTYLDRVTVLLRDKWHESGEGFLEANIIRAQTLTVLRQLDGERKGLLLQFLYESGLIGSFGETTGRQWALVNLFGADLREANLRWANLRGAILGVTNLRKANLREADLTGAILGGADLFWADLFWADLREADLRGADLRGADLTRADLSESFLDGANLSGANLREANLNRANLGGACLTGAKVTDEQLAQAKTLEGATLPDGTVRE